MSTAKEQFYARPALKDAPPELKNAKSLHFFTSDTPNGRKTQIALEELKDAYGLEWTWTGFSITGEIPSGGNYQHQKWYLALDPNGKIPLLVDNAPPSSTDGKPFVIRESAAQLLYFAKEYDTRQIFGFSDEFERNEALQWLFFQTGHLGPMQGQLNHFYIYAPEQIPYAKKRYHDEVLRLYGVLEARLSGSNNGDEPREYLVGGKYSWADIQTFGWVNGWPYSKAITEEEFSKFPHLGKWLERIRARPAVKRALTKYTDTTTKGNIVVNGKIVSKYPEDK